MENLRDYYKYWSVGITVQLLAVLTALEILNIVKYFISCQTDPPRDPAGSVVLCEVREMPMQIPW